MPKSMHIPHVHQYPLNDGQYCESVLMNKRESRYFVGVFNSASRTFLVELSDLQNAK